MTALPGASHSVYSHLSVSVWEGWRLRLGGYHAASLTGLDLGRRQHGDSGERHTRVLLGAAGPRRRLTAAVVVRHEGDRVPDER